MKISKKTGIIAIVLVAAIALMGFGFAAWSTTLTATGNVTAKAEWDVEWKEAAKIIQQSDYASFATDADKPTAPTSTTTPNDTLSLGNVTFGAPGAFIKYSCTVINKGTIPATLTSDNIVKTDVTNDHLTLTVPDSICEVIQPTKTCTFEVLIELDDDFTAGTTSSDNAIDFTDAFELQLVYEPAEDTQTPVDPSHAEA